MARVHSIINLLHLQVRTGRSVYILAVLTYSSFHFQVASNHYYLYTIAQLKLFSSLAVHELISCCRQRLGTTCFVLQASQRSRFGEKLPNPIHFCIFFFKPQSGFFRSACRKMQHGTVKIMISRPDPSKQPFVSKLSQSFRRC